MIKTSIHDHRMEQSKRVKEKWITTATNGDMKQTQFLWWCANCFFFVHSLEEKWTLIHTRLKESGQREIFYLVTVRQFEIKDIYSHNTSEFRTIKINTTITSNISIKKRAEPEPQIFIHFSSVIFSHSSFSFVLCWIHLLWVAIYRNNRIQTHHHMHEKCIWINFCKFNKTTL